MAAYIINKKTICDSFDYADGSLIWKKTHRMGIVAGCNHHTGYRVIKLGKKTYLEHRLIYLYHHGILPPSIDHIDRNKLNNRIENLRAANDQQNQANASLQKRNKSGYKGVYFLRSINKWRAKISVNKKQVTIGHFDCPQKAALAFNNMSLAVNGEFAYINQITTQQSP